MPLSVYVVLEVKQGDDIATPASERAKRRHARPHELDSDDDADGGKEDNTLQDEVEAIVPVDDDPHILVNGDFA